MKSFFITFLSVVILYMLLTLIRCDIFYKRVRNGKYPIKCKYYIGEDSDIGTIYEYFKENDTVLVLHSDGTTNIYSLTTVYPVGITFFH